MLILLGKFGRPNGWHLLLLGALALILPATTQQAAAANTPSAPTELHTFTNDTGASFQGKVLSVAGDDVSIQREDGKIFRLKTSGLKKEDLAYLHQWTVKDAAAQNKQAFAFGATLIKGTQTDTISARTSARIFIQPENYTLTLKNQTSANWRSLHFKYIVFLRGASGSSPAHFDDGTSSAPGSKDIDSLAVNEAKSIPLEKMTIQTTSLHATVNGKPVNPDLQGIWIRLYDEDNNLLQEWASDPTILKREKWTDPPAPAAKTPPAPTALPASDPPPTAASTPSTKTELHTFTNDSGASFPGKAVGVVGDEASILRNDGKTVHLPIAALSKDDQAYLRHWLVQNAVAQGKSVFSIRAAVVKAPVATSQDSASHLFTFTWSESYTLAIKNQTPANWHSLRLRYVIFSRNSYADLMPEAKPPLRTNGDLSVEKYAANEEKNFPLKVLSLSRTTPGTYRSSTPPNPPTILNGLWVRVYDEDDELLQEWASDPSIPKAEKWTNPPATTTKSKDPNSKETAPPASDPFAPPPKP